MTSALRLIAVTMLLVGAQSMRVTVEMEGRANPIRKVVNMLQGMHKKVEAEGKRDQELFDKYMCYCKSGAGSLAQSISEAENKIPQVESSLKEAQEQEVQAKSDLKTAQEARREAEKAIAEATKIREKEAAAYAKESSEQTTNIAAMGKAITALEKGAKGEFLQTQAASTIRRLTVSMEMSDTSRDMLSAFLSAGEGYAPASGEITGILKQMADTMAADLAQNTKDEEAAKASFAELSAAKEKEIAANTKAIEAKMTLIGELAVSIVNMKEDLDDTAKSMAEDKKFLADLDKNCATKEEEYEVVKKTRSEELLAISETIKILNDDDALELFKKTLPGSSLLQVKVSSKEVRQRALQALKGKKGGYKMDMILMALTGKKVSFDKVLGMIDEMVSLLGKEQGDDDDKKEYCNAALDKAEDKHKVLDQKQKDLQTQIEDTNGNIETLTEEIAALSKGIKNLDKDVADATETRKEENTENTETCASNNAVKEILGFAKNRLNKFYNPKLYKPPAKKELSKEDRIVENMSLMQGAPPPPPEAVGAYKKKGEQSTGVIAMMDLMIADVDKETQEIETEEKNAQEEYEQFMDDSKDKRAADSKSIEEKEGAKAEGEGSLEKATLERKDTLHAAMATAKVIGELHTECDWLLTNYDNRKAARAGEVDSLKNAKAVLSGADFSLVQTGFLHRRM